MYASDVEVELGFAPQVITVGDLYVTELWLRRGDPHLSECDDEVLINKPGTAYTKLLRVIDSNNTVVPFELYVTDGTRSWLRGRFTAEWVDDTVVVALRRVVTEEPIALSLPGLLGNKRFAHQVEEATLLQLKKATSETEDSEDESVLVEAAVSLRPSLYNGHSLPTHFDGVRFRSRAESRFALLLHTLNIRYVYEPVKFRLASGSTYTADFWLPETQLFVEIKPVRPHIEEESRCEEMSKSGFRVVLLVADCTFEPPFDVSGTGRHANALRGYAWVDGVKLAGVVTFVVGAPAVSNILENIGDSSLPHLGQIASTRDSRWNHPHLLEAAATAARRCREDDKKWNPHFATPARPLVATCYLGVEYNTKTEAAFAALLDCLKIRHAYKFATFRGFTPTFFCPDFQLYFVIGVVYPSVAVECACETLSENGARVVYMYGDNPLELPYSAEGRFGKKRKYSHQDSMIGMTWVNGLKLSGDVVFVVGPPTASCALECAWVDTTTAHPGLIRDTNDRRWEHPDIAAAMGEAQDMIK